MESPDELSHRFLKIVTASPVIEPMLNDWDSIGLSDCWLVAGVLVQSVWNNAFGFDPDFGLSDIDLVYCDRTDLTEESENLNSERINSLFSHLPVRIDVKNEARVHLWYEQKFGYAIEPYRSTESAITTFPTTATAVGIRPDGQSVAVCAPFGLRDLMNLIVRPNKRQITRSVYDAKVSRWITKWPELSFVDWDEGQKFE